MGVSGPTQSTPRRWLCGGLAHFRRAREPGECDLASLIASPIAHARGDAVGRGEQMRAERAHELAEGDRRGGRRQADRCADLADLVAHGHGDRVELGGELLVVDGETFLAYLPELSLTRPFLLVIVPGPRKRIGTLL